MNEALETARYVAERSLWVQIDTRALSRFSRQTFAFDIKVPPWDSFHHFCDHSEDTVAYLLVLDSLNFCFWPPSGKPRWEIRYKTKRLSGYYVLAACLKHAIESGIPITNSQYLAELSLGELIQILGGQGILQLLKQRLKTIHELGNALLNGFGGQAHRLVEAAQGSSIRLSKMLAEKIPSFRDVAEYRGHKVFFYKRAQLFAADLYGAFEGKRWGRFVDVDQLTAFADYKLPQVLHHLGILNYAKTLARKVDHQVNIQAGSPEEIEIRANTIWSVELIRQKLERMGKRLRSFEIDSILWNLGQRQAFKAKPFHRTVTIYY